MNKVFDAYAAYYDLLYKDKDYAGEADYVCGLLRKQGLENGELLELGCGTGNHAKHFAHMGFSIHGVDMSPVMVEAAKKRTSQTLTDNLSFEVGDARSVRVGCKFDAVISLFHVASYQTTNEDIRALFATAAEHLNPGGVFIFDFWYGPGVLTDRPVVRVKRLSNESIEVLRIAEPVMHPNINIVDVNYTVLVTDRVVEKITQLHEKHSMRYFFIPELESMLEEAGFNIEVKAEWVTGVQLGYDSWLGTICAQKI